MGFWGSRFQWVDGRGRTVMTLAARGLMGRKAVLDLEPGSSWNEEVVLLAAVGWYVILLMQDDAAAAVVVTA